MSWTKAVPLCACAAFVLFSAARVSAAVPRGPDAFPSLTTDGCWTWYAEPKAVYFEGKYKRTYIGWTSQTGKQSIAYYDHTTGATATKILPKGYGKDDHNHPAIIMRPDGRILVFNTGHDGKEISEYISLAPESIDSFLIVSPYPVSGDWYCYPNAMFLKNEGDSGRFFLFHRGLDTDPYYTYSDDWGMTWAKDKHYFANNPHASKPYVKYGSNGIDEIHIVVERAHRAGFNPSYYLKYKGGAFYQITGEKLGDTNSLPIMNTVIDTLVHPSQYSSHGTCWDVAPDKNGNPVVLYDMFIGTPSVHKYWYFRWTGSSWFKKEMVNAGTEVGAEGGFACGFTLDHEYPNIVYVARWIGSAPEIEKWTTCDGGSTWKTQAITSGSTKKNYRPCVPRGHKSGMKCNLVWLYGDYSALSTYTTSVKYLDEVMNDDSTSCTGIEQGATKEITRGLSLQISGSTISVSCANPSLASLKVFGLNGILVADLTPQVRRMNARRIRMPLSLTAGTYVFRLDDGNASAVRKIAVIK